ncbi:MAG: OmpH family outer membrane protein [Alphaproteobacteria bacterium]|nr:OmpH family outer membrane protein [Alphaproteobacteria bacterium]
MAKENKTETNTPKFGIVNVQAVVAQTPGVVDLRNEQEAKRREVQEWINARNAEIAAAEEAKKAELTKKYQGELNERQQKMQAEYAQKVQALDANLNKLITEIAEKEHLNYVFNVGSLVFGGMDITSQVLEKLNAK